MRQSAACVGVDLPPTTSWRHAAPAQITTLQDLFRRNTEPRDQSNAPFPPHKIIGNIYYVSTPVLASFLITTPGGNILINSDFEAT